MSGDQNAGQNVNMNKGNKSFEGSETFAIFGNIPNELNFHSWKN
jgi:hypothetical protein